MKIALISDIHFGCKKSDKIFLENQLSFFKNEFLPHLKNNDITTIAILGDLFDNRNMLNSYMYSEVYKLFDLFEYENLTVYIFPGNHDIYFRTSIEIHSLNFLKKFKNVKFIEDVECIELFGRSLLFVPWQVDYNEFKKLIANKNIRCDVCLGHFDIIGFPFNGSVICKEGIDTNIFINNYTLTFSGHFHTRHIYKNGDKEVIMIGSPFQKERGENNEKGFCVLDLENLKYEFVNSQNTIKFVELKFPEEFETKFIKGNFVDVYVNYDGKFIDNDVKKYLELIEKCEPSYTPNVHITNSLFDSINENYEIKDLSEMFEDFVGSLEIENKSVIKKMIDDLYNKAKGQ